MCAETVTSRVTRLYRDADGNLVRSGQSSVASSQIVWLHADHLSSVSAGTDETGAVVSRQLFAPYGEALGGDGMAGVPWGWATHRPAEGHGLVFMRARWYAPGACPERSRKAGRFVSADPIPDGAGTGIGHARYDYGRGNPMMNNEADIVFDANPAINTGAETVIVGPEQQTPLDRRIFLPTLRR